MNASNVKASIYNLTNVVDKQGKRDARFEGKANCSAMHRWRPAPPSIR
jgi:hypothetical protein